MTNKSGPKVIPTGDDALDRKREMNRRNKQAQRARNAHLPKQAARRPTRVAAPAPKPATTSADFIAAGGVIEVLPGIQQSTTYLPRRPVTQFRGAQAI